MNLNRAPGPGPIWNGPGGGKPILGPNAPKATVALIAINVGIHALLSLAPDQVAVGVYETFGLNPAILSGNRPDVSLFDMAVSLVTVVTALFLHVGFMHLFGNMLLLLMFGGLTERALGPRPVVALFLGAGCAGQIISAVININDNDLMVGASSGVSGLLGAYVTLALLAKRRGVAGSDAEFRRAMILFAIWLVFELLAMGNPAVNIAAHFAGLFSGVGLLLLLPRPRSLGRPAAPGQSGWTSRAGRQRRDMALEEHRCGEVVPFRPRHKPAPQPEAVPGGPEPGAKPTAATDPAKSESATADSDDGPNASPSGGAAPSGSPNRRRRGSRIPGSF